LSVINERLKRISPIWILILLWCLVHVFLMLFFGHRKLVDAEGYLIGADYILSNGTLEDVHHTFYLTHVGSILFFRWLFPDLIFPVLVFQCVVSGVALILLYKACLKIFNNPLAGFFSCVIFLLWWDNIHWNTTLMTESLACSLTCILIYLLSRFKGSIEEFIWIFVLFVLIFFTRPTGVIPITGVISFLLAYYWESISKVRGLKVVLICSLLVLGVIAADQMFLHWDFTEQYIQGNIVTYMSTVEGTPLYEPSLRLDPSELIIPPSDGRPLIKMLTFIFNNPTHFIKAGILKFFYLMSGTRPYYTMQHNAFTLTWLTIVYLFFFFGWKQLTNKPIRVFVFTIIVMNCMLVSASTVDWDNRFYVTMEPVIVLVAGRGGVFILEIFQKSVALKKLKNKFLLK
jgi:hypothetical protein